MRKKGSSLQSLFWRMAITPLICLGLSVFGITAYIVYASVGAETRDGLDNLAHALYRICLLTDKGDYSLRDGDLYKGERKLDTSIVDNIYDISGVDATLFYGEERILTSIRKEDGSRATGTRTAPEVAESVLIYGNDYFSDRVPVNGIPYYGYYMPLRNGNQRIVGMVFVGKPRSTVIEAMMRALLLIFSATAVIGAAAAAVAMFYSRGLIFSLNGIKEYLGAVTEGDMEIKLDSAILDRTDEIGEMGRFSVMLQESIQCLVGTDALTGLYNRRSANLFLAARMREKEKTGAGFTLAIGDIDDFKKINDRFGHQAGDEVLRALSAIFLSHMEEKGQVARWGGEEFLFLYETADKARAAVDLGELQKEIRETTFVYEGNNIHVTMTFGAAECGDACLDRVLKQADDNLYRGKKMGKDCTVC